MSIEHCTTFKRESVDGGRNEKQTCLAAGSEVACAGMSDFCHFPHLFTSDRGTPKEKITFKTEPVINPFENYDCMMQGYPVEDTSFGEKEHDAAWLACVMERAVAQPSLDFKDMVIGIRYSLNPEHRDFISPKPLEPVPPKPSIMQQIIKPGGVQMTMLIKPQVIVP